MGRPLQECIGGGDRPEPGGDGGLYRLEPGAGRVGEGSQGLPVERIRGGHGRPGTGQGWVAIPGEGAVAGPGGARGTRAGVLPKLSVPGGKRGTGDAGRGRQAGTGSPLAGRGVAGAGSQGAAQAGRLPDLPCEVLLRRGGVWKSGVCGGDLRGVPGTLRAAEKDWSATLEGIIR